MAVAGYSGTPLAKKLGLKSGLRYWPIGASDSLFADLGDGEWRLVEQGPADVIHLFTLSRAELVEALPELYRQAAPGAAIWISWPKKASKRPTDLTEDVLREVILPTGWVDVKVCAVDAMWSGLCFRRRRA